MKEKQFFVEDTHEDFAKFMVLTCCRFWFTCLFILNLLNGSLINSRPDIIDGKQIASEISEMCLSVVCELMPGEENRIVESWNSLGLMGLDDL